MALKWRDLIEERKDVMMGKPVFKGTRLTVEHVLRDPSSSSRKVHHTAGPTCPRT